MLAFPRGGKGLLTPRPLCVLLHDFFGSKLLENRAGLLGFILVSEPHAGLRKLEVELGDDLEKDGLTSQFRYGLGMTAQPIQTLPDSTCRP